MKNELFSMEANHYTLAGLLKPIEALNRLSEDNYRVVDDFMRSVADCIHCIEESSRYIEAILR